jgi:hypothetical protein
MKRHFDCKAKCCRKFQAEIRKSIISVFDDKIIDTLQPDPSPDPLSLDEESPAEEADISRY